MKPRSDIYRIALYVHHVLHIHEFTTLQLRKYAIDAQLYYNARISRNIIDEKHAILLRYNFDDASWCDVLRNSCSFYFAPDERTRRCNNEIRALMRDVLIVNNPPQLSNYTSSCARAAVKRNIFQRCAMHNHRATYCIASKYVNHEFFA